MQGVSESKTEKGCYGTMLDSLQLMAKHPVYLENNVAVLCFFVQRHKNQEEKSIWKWDRIWG